LVENEIGKRLKCLKSNTGGEYCSKEFDDYCSYHGIHREKTVPGTSKKNGVSKRMNRTIMERARNMRLHVGLPLKFWTDIVDVVFYIINKVPSRSLDGGILEEAWTRKKVNYSFRKTFDCEAYVHIDKENRTKIEEKSKSVPLLDTMLIILVITYVIIKIIKSLGVEMWYCHTPTTTTKFFFCLFFEGQNP
jgi:hypothetical protein